MRIFDKVQTFKKDIRSINRPVDDVIRLVKSYVNKAGWLITEERGENQSVRIVCKNSRASLLTFVLRNSPQIAIWEIYPDTERKGTRVAIFFDLLHSSRIFFYSVVIGIFLAAEYAVIQFVIIKIGLVVLIKFLSVFLFWALFQSRVDSIEHYQNFKNGFYKSISDAFGIQETIIQEGFCFPEAYRYFIIAIIFFVQLMPLLSLNGAIKLSSFFTFGFSFFPKLAILMLFIGVVFLVAISCKPHYVGRLKLGLLGLQTGSFLSFINMFPLFFQTIIERQDIDADGLMIGMVVIFFVMIFMAINMFDVIKEMAEGIYHPKTREDIFLSRNDQGRASREFSLFIICIWLSFAIINLIGLCVAVNYLGHFLLGKGYFSNALLNDLFNYNPFIKAIGLGIMIMPLFFWFPLACWRIKQWVAYSRLIARSKVPQDLQDTLGCICGFAGVRIPKIAISSEDVIAANVKHIPTIGATLKITRRALVELKNQEIEALLAHEVAHLKKHSLKFVVFNLLSQWTLFGRGFLVLMQDSREMEFEADNFSLAWLEEKGCEKEVLVNLLDKISLLNSTRGVAFSDSVLSFSANLKSGFNGNNIMTAIKFVLEVLLGDIVISYVHPTAEERIRRIEQV